MAEKTEKAETGGAGLDTKLIIIIVLSMVVAVGASVGITVAVIGGDSAAKEVAEAQDAGDEDTAEPEAEPIYISLDPPFVVNFQDKNQRSKFLKAELSVVTRNPAMEALIEKHMPAIRNSLVLLFSRQVYEDLVSNEGKEKLRAEALAAVQDVLEKQTGDPGVEELFFSSLVMQ